MSILIRPEAIENGRVNGDIQNHGINLRRTRLSGAGGRQFGGDRDIYDEAGYPNTESINFQHYYDRFRRQDLAERIIKLPAKQTWRDGPDLKRPDNVDEGVFVNLKRQFRLLRKSTQLWEKLQRLDIAQRIGEYGVLVIGLKDGRDLDQPAGQVSGPSDVAYLRPIHQGDVSVHSFDDETSSPRFGMPEEYRVDFSDDANTNQTLEDVAVHHTRVIHAAEGVLEDETYGKPALESVFNRLMDIQKILASAGEMFWKNSRNLLALTNQDDYEISTSDKDDFDAEMKEMYHSLKQWGIFNGIELENVGPDIADPSDAFDTIISVIAGAADIPKRILIGQELGELASQQDERQFMSTIEERRNTFATHQIVRPLIDRLQKLGALQQVEYDLRWPELFQLNKLEQARVSNNMAKAALAISKATTQSNVITEAFAKEVLGAEIRDDDLEQALMEEADEEIAEMVEEEGLEPGGI